MPIEREGRGIEARRGLGVCRAEACRAEECRAEAFLIPFLYTAPAYSFSSRNPRNWITADSKHQHRGNRLLARPKCRKRRRARPRLSRSCRGTSCTSGTRQECQCGFKLQDERRHSHAVSQSPVTCHSQRQGSACCVPGSEWNRRRRVAGWWCCRDWRGWRRTGSEGSEGFINAVAVLVTNSASQPSYRQRSNLTRSTDSSTMTEIGRNFSFYLLWRKKYFGALVIKIVVKKIN